MESLSKIILGAFVMAFASRLLGEWNLFYKNTKMEWLGRVVFWGGGTALASIIGGMPVSYALALVPSGISCAIIPPALSINFNDNIFKNVIKLITCAFISFIPIMFIFWFRGYFWPKLIVISCLLPVVYSCSKFLKINIWQLQTSDEIAEFLLGLFLGADLVIAILLKPENPWPALPNFLQFINK